MKPAPAHNQNGFTLIEIIITLVVLSALISMVLPLTSSFLSQAGAPVNNLQNTISVYQTMEQINAEYLKLLKTARGAGTTVNLSTFKTAIGSGTVSNTFGNYTVEESQFIAFVGGIEQASGSTILKIRISNGSGVILTGLFTAK